MKDDAGTVRLLETEWGAVPTHILFSADNTYDIGDATHAVRTIYIDTSIVLGAAASKIIPGATSFSVRNNADNADNLLISNAGAVTLRNTITSNATNASLLKAGDSSTTVLQGQRSDASQQAKIDYTGAGTWSVTGSLLLNTSGTIVDKDGDSTVTILRGSRTDASNASTLDYSGGGYFNITGNGLGIGVASPQGKLHVYDTDGGQVFWRGTSIDTTPQTIVTGITNSALISILVDPSTGGSTYDVAIIGLNGNETVFDDGTNRLRVAIDGSGNMTILRIAGTATFSVVCSVLYR